MELTLDNAIDFLVENIKSEYLTYTLRGKRLTNDVDIEGLSVVNRNMIADFNAGLSVRKGRKYIKIISNNSVWGFIVAGDGGKFPKGTILKAAGWNAPATNHSRGNVLTGGYKVEWTGPLYM